MRRTSYRIADQSMLSGEGKYVVIIRYKKKQGDVAKQDKKFKQKKS